jgi:hypothetical protein
MQLALQEWLVSFEVIDSVRKKSCKGDLDDLSKQLQKLLLFSLDNPFAMRAGSLDKLCFFSDELIARFPLKLADPLDSLLDQMHDEVLSFRKKLMGWKRKSPLLETVSIETNKVCDKLTFRLNQFYDALVPFFEESRSDENVLFYLIEHIEIFNQILSPRKIEDLLQHLYPAGPAHLRAILCEGYTRRGFGSFYAKHEELINSIEWMADEWTLTPALH